MNQYMPRIRKITLQDEYWYAAQECKKSTSMKILYQYNEAIKLYHKNSRSKSFHGPKNYQLSE